MHRDEIASIMQHQLRVFWMSIFLVPGVEGAEDAITPHGTTWLELFLLCIIRGGKVVRQQFPGESHILPKFNLLFKTFCRLSKGLLQSSRQGSYLYGHD